MISPRNAYITLLRSKKSNSNQKARQAYMVSKIVNKPTENSVGKQKGYLLSKDKSLQKFRKSYNRGHSINETNRQSSSKLQSHTTRRLSNKKTKTDAFSNTLTTARQTYEQQFRKNKEGENCRLVVKVSGESQKDFFLKVSNISDIENYLHECYPKAKSFTTMPRQISLQFLLTQENVPGQFLNGQTLYFKAEINSKLQKSNQNKTISLQDFQLFKQLGSGGFSKVFLCKSKLDNNFYAIKLIQKQMVVKNHKKGIVMNQRNIMTKSKHPFLIQLRYAFESQKYIAFVLEYCPGGQLFGLIKKYGRLTEDVAKFYIIQVLLGISYLHSQKVVYRDIKPQNILLGIDGHVKIADLGLAKPDMYQGKLAHSFCGSPQYMSPQMILQVGHTFPVDFYCVGALLYELLTGLPPFYSQDPNQIYEAVLQQDLTFPADVDLTNQCKNLLKGLLNKDPKQRLGSLYGSKQILVHPWFGKQNLQNFLDKKVRPPVTFNKLQKLNLDFNDKDKHKQNLQKVLKDQKHESKQYKNIMNNFYFDLKPTEHQLPQMNKLLLKQNSNNFSTERRGSQNKLKSTPRRSVSKESKQNMQPIRKMKKKGSVGMALQSSLQYFFRK